MTHTCPGLCGRIVDALFACPACTRMLPAEVRTTINTTWWAGDWPAHSRALTDALHWLAGHQHFRPGRPRRTGHRGHTGGEAS